MAFNNDDQLAQQNYYNNPLGYYPGGHGSYQYIDMEDIIDNFMATYVGEGKLLEKTIRGDASFHGHRALQELSYDTLRSHRSQEIEIPPSLSMVLPHDYVNYVKLSWSDESGIEHVIYPGPKTSNPTAIKQNDDGDYKLTAVGTLTSGSDSITLDDEYTNIAVGMFVSSPNIPAGSVVKATSTTSGITTITIDIASGATYTGTETLTFKLNEDLLEQVETSLVLTGLSWTGGEDKITAASAGDAGTVKVGMSVSHEDFTADTIVVDVNGAVITTSTVAANTGSSENVNFISYTKISDTWSGYKSVTPSENNENDYEDDTYWPHNGQRYGIDPQHAQVNGSFYIDYRNGKIHFSSNLSGKTVILKYISDGIDTRSLTGMLVPKMAEEAIYKWMIYGCASARIDIPEYVIRRLKKERFAEIRKAKLRLSNIKLEEISQILRGKSKQIKH